ncbi:Tim44-like domain-containing protein [Curvibacter sp. APW13]|uniref:Tim44 domain-containing protein n=1 Tax=Curvibacter sp. APW13 TaxID=3077236 RepID=UPI0028DE5F59|nr:Tim44-like domain-containing protein [Curvibacter sp. APW13]MDT8989506.1 Tim44-like domain-containing protein [Curvibacter sp. APW13]
MKLWNLFLAAALVLTGVHAEAAKRLGGGGSMGKQSSNVTQRQATPAPAPAPAQNSAAAPSANKPVAPTPTPAPAQPAKRPWGAMLGGLAAGLGLAWLAHSMGLGEGMGNMLTLLLFAGLVFMAISWFMRRRASPVAVGGYAAQGAGHAPFAVSQPYNPKNVGNDASARPWERNSTAFQAPVSATSGGSIIGSALSGAQNWGIPAGFDTDGFVKAAKTNFINLQAAWDKGDIATLRSMMTDDMVAEIKAQLAEREKQQPGMANMTEVVMLDAHLLGIEELDAEYMASVEFSGMIREEAGTSPNPFREVWNMTKPKAGGGWLVAGVQALQ